jgi:hypothetical protein
MLQDRSADAEPDEPAPDEADVIVLGEESAPPHRGRSFRPLDRIRADPRSAPLAVAALGLAAVFGSLVSPWATMRIRETSGTQFEPNEIVTGAADTGIGTGYLVGVLAVVALTAMAIFGTRQVRHNARVAGMATAAGLLVLLVAATASFENTARQRFLFGPQFEIDARYDLGLTLAYAGAAALGLALYLAARSWGRSPAPDDGNPGEPDDAGERRPRQGWVEPDESVRDVTVLPAPPFANPEWRQQHPR